MCLCCVYAACGQMTVHFLICHIPRVKDTKLSVYKRSHPLFSKNFVLVFLHQLSFKVIFAFFVNFNVSKKFELLYVVRYYWKSTLDRASPVLFSHVDGRLHLSCFFGRFTSYLRNGWSRLERHVHCNENPIYVFLLWELHGLSPNFHIPVSVSNLFIPRIGPHTVFGCSKIDRPILEICESLTDI
jgi:hypothetical protein